MHYRRWRRRGTPERRTVAERFALYVAPPASNGCWEWIGNRYPTGYGSFRLGEKQVVASRFSYELHRGPIPEGMVIDHLCRNRACVNPDHLEVVTFRENVLRGEGIAARYARRDSCIRGHSFDPPNGYATKQGARACRACDRIRYEARQSRKKSQ